MRRVMGSVLVAWLLIAAPADADTPSRSSPFTPRADPAADQYTSPAASASAAAPPSAAAPASTLPGQVAGEQTAVRGRREASRRGRGDTAGATAEVGAGAVAVPVSPGGGVRGAGSDAGGTLPFTGGPLGAVIGTALALLLLGVLLRLYGVRTARRKPSGRTMRGLS
jgi:hypothetical protein